VTDLEVAFDADALRKKYAPQRDQHPAARTKVEKRTDA
jgi:hypothetical protein